MYKAVLLDDEAKGRNTLKTLLGEYCPEIDIVAAAASAEQAYQSICKYHPQILFLDIEIGKAGSDYNTSFELLAKLPKYSYEVIFVTAYDHYALKAIQSHAVGYILKPVAIDDLVDSVNSGIEKLQLTGINDRLKDLLQKVHNTRSTHNRIWVHSQQDMIPIVIDDIIRFEAQGGYTDIFCDGGRKITSSKNMGEYLEMLNDTEFIKVHRSHIVNVSKIVKYSKTDGGWVTTVDNADLPVSKNGRERLLKIL